MTNKYSAQATLQAGPLRVGFFFSNADVYSLFQDRYSMYLADEEPDIRLDIILSSELTPGYAADIKHSGTEASPVISSSALYAELSLLEKSGCMRISANENQIIDSLENGLRVIMQRFALLHDSFFIHAAAVAMGSSGVLMPGSEGAGKSTIAELCARADLGILGDDLILITTGQLPSIHPTPFRGETLVQDFRNEPALLDWIFFIGRGKGINTEKLSSSRAIAHLMTNIPFIQGLHSEGVQHLLSITSRIIPPHCYDFRYDLESHPESEIVHCLKKVNV